MIKITFLGAGSTIFAKNVLGDVMLCENIKNIEIALVDIDPIRLEDSRIMLERIRKETGREDVIIISYQDRKEALRGADFAVNAIQVGGYKPCTVTDFEIPAKYGLRQTIADTLGIGGIFRALRTMQILEEFAREMEEVCPEVIFLNYTNPMAILSGYLQRYTKIRTVGLCHSVQVCASTLLNNLKMNDKVDGCRWKISGINHQAWLLEIADKDGNDLYPEIKRRAVSALAKEEGLEISWDFVRLDLMLRLGFYNTESPEHTAEYSPWYIKKNYPELIERFHIPLDDYIKRCIAQIENWEKQRDEIIHGASLNHTRTNEFASYIIEAVITDKPFRIHGNVLNTGLIPNLPAEACVEVPCFIDRNGINPSYMGNLPEVCASVNRTNINVQLMTIEAYVKKSKAALYQAAMLDPHTAAELSPDDIVAMCDEMIAEHTAHGDKTFIGWR